MNISNGSADINLNILKLKYKKTDNRETDFHRF